MEKIFTHDEAMCIVELFDELLSDNDIFVPSPEDEDRDYETSAALYGTPYDDLLTAVEDRIKDILRRHTPETEVVTDVFSGTV